MMKIVFSNICIILILIIVFVFASPNYFNFELINYVSENKFFLYLVIDILVS